MAGGASSVVASAAAAQTGGAKAAPSPAAASASNAKGPRGGAPIAIVAGVDVLGVRIGMPDNKAIAALKAKGITASPSAEAGGDLVEDRQGALVSPNVELRVTLTKTTSPPLVAAVWYTDNKQMLEAAVVSAFRSKYGSQGFDLGVAPTNGFVRVPNQDSCLKSLNQPSTQQQLQACIALPRPEGGHVIVWHYDEHGKPLTQAGFERYCPKKVLEVGPVADSPVGPQPQPQPVCKAITVVARYSVADAAGAVSGFSAELRSDWLLKHDSDEQRRQEAEQQAQAEKKRREAEVEAARRNQPRL